VARYGRAERWRVSDDDLSPTAKGGPWRLVLPLLRSARAGEQLFLSYGRRTSGQLLCFYGWCPPPGTNPHDASDVELRLRIERMPRGDNDDDKASSSSSSTERSSDASSSEEDEPTDRSAAGSRRRRALRRALLVAVAGQPVKRGGLGAWLHRLASPGPGGTPPAVPRRLLAAAEVLTRAPGGEENGDGNDDDDGTTLGGLARAVKARGPEAVWVGRPSAESVPGLPSAAALATLSSVVNTARDQLGGSDGADDDGTRDPRLATWARGQRAILDAATAELADLEAAVAREG